MKNWLNNDQDLGPFNTTSPMDADEIVDQIQCWCNIPDKLKDLGEVNKNKHKHKSGDAKFKDNDQCQNKRNKKNGDHQGCGNHKPRGRGHKKNNSKIDGHEKYKKHNHNWFNCFLNPCCCCRVELQGPSPQVERTSDQKSGCLLRRCIRPRNIRESAHSEGNKQGGKEGDDQGQPKGTDEGRGREGRKSVSQGVHRPRHKEQEGPETQNSRMMLATS